MPSEIFEPLLWGWAFACVSSLGFVSAAIALRHARAELRRTKAEQSLLQALGQQAHKRQQLYSSLIRNTPGISFRCSADEDWTLSFISDSVETMTGWPASDFIEQRRFFRDIIHRDDYARITAEGIQAVSENRSFQLEYRLVHRDGRVFWVWSHGSAFYDEQDRIKCVDGVIIDIDRRKATELALRESEELTRTLLRNFPGIWARCGMAGSRILAPIYLSDAVESLTGWSAADFVHGRKTMSDLLMPDDTHTVSELSRQLRTTGSFSLEYRLLRRDATTIWVWGRGSVVRDDHGQPLWLDAVFIDVSERRAAEQALRESEQLASSLLQNIRGASVRAQPDEARTLVFVSDGIERFTGWSAAEFLALNKGLNDFVHPDDKARVKSEARAGLQASNHYSVEYRMQRRDGSMLWVLSHGAMVFDDAQQPQWIDIIIMDISERHAREEALRLAKERAEAALAKRLG